MNVHPAILALRGDWASQRRAQEPLLQTIGAWRWSTETRAVEADLMAYDEGASLDDCEALSDVLGDHRRALTWVLELFDGLMPKLRAEPLGDLPLQFSCSNGFATIQLLAHGRVTLHVVAHEPRQLENQPESVLLVDRESTELILNGTAEGVWHRFGECDGDRREVISNRQCWQVGDRIQLRADDGRHLLKTDRTLLSLQLVRSAVEPRPTRRYDLRDGRLLDSASGNKQSSRDLMALGVLGAMPIGGTMETMERIASEPLRDADLRWEAVRQALAIDSSRGFALLAVLAQQSGDPLALPAARLKAQLIAAHPVLAELERKAA